jgi:hypothetical protein
MEENRNTYNILVIKPEGQKSLQIPRHRWKRNIQMDLKEV